jgi:hypothetical protein
MLKMAGLNPARVRGAIVISIPALLAPLARHWVRIASEDSRATGGSTNNQASRKSLGTASVASRSCPSFISEHRGWKLVF